jgi:glycosyltransferase involved in cell wall biosynthesis
MPRSIICDITPLSRTSLRDLAGIDRVAFAYARHYAATSRPNMFGAYFGAWAPHLIGAAELKAILQCTERAWRDDVPAEADAEFIRVLTWLSDPRSIMRTVSGADAPHGVDQTHRIALHARHWISSSMRPLPARAIYLNVFNAGREHRFLFDWLGHYPGIRAVFFVHDLLPLDHPEYFRTGYLELTRRRLATIAGCGSAFITSTRVVCDRLLEVLGEIGRSKPPVHIAPLPSPLPSTKPIVVPTDPSYFVIIGTIEPRKNHLLLLDLWRELARRRGPVPKLVAVGGRGWKNREVLDRFERDTAIRPYVLKAERMSKAALAQLVAGARALLMPSFDEGYGLPVIEALTLGTPVIASDIAAFREITQGCATLLPPRDGKVWQDAIVAFAGPSSPVWSAAKVKASQFRPLNWLDYFGGLEDFLDSLETL